MDNSFIAPESTELRCAGLCNSPATAARAAPLGAFSARMWG